MSQMYISTLKKDPINIDQTRVFYHRNGGFKHDWIAWEVSSVEGKTLVSVIWPNYKVILTDSDALNFLTIVKSKHTELLRQNHNKS